MRQGPGYLKYMAKKRKREEIESGYDVDSDYDSELENELMEIERNYKLKKKVLTFGRVPKKRDTYLVKPVSASFMKFVRIPGTPPSPDRDIEYYSDDEKDFQLQHLYKEDDDEGYFRMPLEDISDYPSRDPSPDPEFDPNSVEVLVRGIDREIGEQSVLINSIIASRRFINSPSYYELEEEE